MTEPSTVQFRPLRADSRLGIAMRDRDRASADHRRLCTDMLAGFAPQDASWVEPWFRWEGTAVPDLVDTSLGFPLFADGLRTFFTGLRAPGFVTWHACYLQLEGRVVELATPELERPHWVIDENSTVRGSSGLPMKAALDPRVRDYHIVAVPDGGHGFLLREDVFDEAHQRFTGFATSDMTYRA